MRKTGFLLLGSLAAACTLALWHPLAAKAQNAPDAAQTTDPKALLLAAAALNGAPGPDAKPWHAEISFTLNGTDGKPESQGTFEEFWASPDKIKLIYSTSIFNQVEYTTPAGIRRTGTSDSAPSEIIRVVNQFLQPIPLNAASINAAKVQGGDVSLGSTKLSCVTVTRDAASDAEVVQANPLMRSLWAKLIPPNISTFCLVQSAPILRMIISDGGASRIVRNGMTRFADRVLPQSVEEMFSSSPSSDGKLVYRAKLETIEALGSIDDTQFTPPADAVPAPKVITLAERDTSSRRVHHSYPQDDYQLPGGSKGVHTAAVVVIALRVHTDGTVSPMRLVSGSPNLQEVSMESVRKWTYKPFQLDGKAVEVITTATLFYTLRQ
jgi:Gram-negative bacterial TonB protein C-terminal